MSLGTANGSSASMFQILVSRSLHPVTTVVSASDTTTDATGDIKEAQQSQVTVILSFELRHGPDPRPRWPPASISPARLYNPFPFPRLPRFPRAHSTPCG